MPDGGAPTRSSDPLRTEPGLLGNVEADAFVRERLVVADRAEAQCYGYLLWHIFTTVVNTCQCHISTTVVNTCHGAMAHIHHCGEYLPWRTCEPLR